MGGTNKELAILKTQIGSLDIYAYELQSLEQWDMPSEWRARALKIRNESAPMFFKLVAGLLLDALIQGLANILDRPATFGKDNLTLEYVIQNYPDPTIQAFCQSKLAEIRDGATYSDIKRARNHILSHADYKTIIDYDTLTPRDFPNLKLANLGLMVREIMDMISKMAGQPMIDLIPNDWQGVGVIFNLLEQKKG